MPNGFEFGKQDGSELETFLKTGFSPKLVIGQWSHWDIKIVGNHVTIFVDGTNVVDMYDKTMSSQLGGEGSVMLYNEDAQVNFDNVYITPA